MSGVPTMTLPAWKVVAAIFISLAGIFLIEKIYSKKVTYPLTIEIGITSDTFPGWAPVLGPGESQTTLLYTWRELHRTMESKKEAKKPNEDLD